MMAFPWLETPLRGLPTFLDLLALAIVFGVLICRLWVLPQADVVAGQELGVAASARLNRLLLWALALLTITSGLVLMVRALQMSGRPLVALQAILPTAILHTHYGAVWSLRTGALAGLWLGRWGLGRSRGMLVPATMFLLAAIIAWCHSATGHAADSGDFTGTEWGYWLHVTLALLWIGGLLAVMLALSALLVPGSLGHKAFIAHTMGRLWSGAPLVLIGVVVSGLFNAFVLLGSLPALWQTAYGGALAVKVLLVLATLGLWLLNRYGVVRELRVWLVIGLTPQSRAGPRRGPDNEQARAARLVRWHRGLMGVSACLLLLVLLLTVFLTFNMPPRGRMPMSAMPMQHPAHHAVDEADGPKANGADRP